jgi:hypothetical protein
VSFIGEQSHGDWKEFLIQIRKTLDREEGDWAGDDLDRIMRRREEALQYAYESGLTAQETALRLIEDLDAWS